MEEQVLDETTPEQAPAPKPKMPIGKVVLINFAIMLCYMAITGAGKGEAGLGNLALDAVLVTMQAGLNFLVGFIMVFGDKTKQIGGALMISGLLVGVIGFGACISKAAVFG
jgi:hypothetical protein